jgi:hypothetical protein
MSWSVMGTWDAFDLSELVRVNCRHTRAWWVGWGSGRWEGRGDTGWSMAWLLAVWMLCKRALLVHHSFGQCQDLSILEVGRSRTDIWEI